MAFLRNLSGLTFTGTIGEFSAYTMRGSDKIILRTKGGADKKRIEKDPAFEPTRNLNNEWRVVTRAALVIRKGLNALKPMADYNISGPMNALVKKIQTADTINPKGKRSILFSQQPDVITSFPFNRQTILETLIRQPFLINIDKSSGIIDVTIPQLQPLINFFPNPRYAYFRIILAATAVSDYACRQEDGYYFSTKSLLPKYQAIETKWAGTKVSQPSANFQLISSNNFLPGDGMILLFGAGIQYGMPGADNSIQPVPYAGAARILKGV